MSQTETIMLVALGFVIALAVSLLIIRGVWRYAVGLGKRRIERRAPSAIAELKADRDRLKAEFAMQGRRLQLRLDDLKTRMAEQMAEASRNRNRIEQLASEIGTRDKLVAERDAEIVNLRSQVESLERELADRTVLTQQSRDELRQREEEIAALRQRVATADARLAENSLLLEAVQSPAAALSASAAAGSSSVRPAAASEIQVSQVEDRLRTRIAELNELTRQIDEQRRDLSFQHSELSSLREQLDRSRLVDENLTDTGVDVRRNEAGGEPSISLIDIESAGRKLEEQIIEAEQETENLTAELARLDEIWNSNLNQLNGAAKPDQPEQQKTRTGSKAARKAGKRTADRKDRAKPAAAGKKSRKPGTATKAAKESPARSARNKTARKKATATDAPSGGTSPEDNVISLAQRIRALQSDLGKPKA